MHGTRISKKDAMFPVVDLAPTPTTLQAYIAKDSSFHIDRERLKESKGR
jgi:hypothetical protein